MILIERKLRVSFDGTNADLVQHKPKKMSIDKWYEVIAFRYFTQNFQYEGKPQTRECVNYGIIGDDKKLLFVSSQNCFVQIG